MKREDLPLEFLELLKSVTDLRPKRVIEHILENGYVTTEELYEKFDYNHPPRAARDVRERGIPLETIRVKNSKGKSIGAYKFANPNEVRHDVLKGRKVFPKSFKLALIESNGKKCEICQTKYEERYLQIDHRVPYEVSGDTEWLRNQKDYMLICGACNRQKSWSCEHCDNWNNLQDINICRTCYWSNTNEYSHIALQLIRRLDISFIGEEIAIYDNIKEKAKQKNITIQEAIKDELKE